MPDLSEEVKDRIITHLAQFRTPTETSGLIKEEFGVIVPGPHVSQYNAATPSFNAGAGRAEMFHAQRKAFLAGIEASPLSHQQVRLEKLYRLAQKAEDMGNIALAAQLIEQAAKEVGGIYSNVRHHAHSGSVAREPLSREDAMAELVMRLAAVKERIAADKEKPTAH